MLRLEQKTVPGTTITTFHLVNEKGVVQMTASNLPEAFSWLWKTGNRFITVPTKGKHLVVRLMEYAPAPRSVR